ncbi:MAG TPA: NAD(P)H-hydrate dehydratase [Syntrophorhabdaceae bacterium]|nr:NAD(P)H-hydrate dehydratase [Syntrophorhabdaceae bacterium]
MVVLSPERMASYDRYAIDKWGIPSTVLMENAGRGAYRFIRTLYLTDKSRIVIVCGRGNNGGDGFVIARYALRDGHMVKVFLLGEKQSLKGDAAVNMRLFESIGGNIIELKEYTDSIKTALRHGDIVIDAIFGTGLSKPVSGIEKAVIEDINEYGKKVIAVDIPSGIDGKTGKILGAAILAHHTFTFAYPKLGHFIYPGAYHTGKLTVIDISMPDFIENELGIDGYVVDTDMIRSFLKPRLPWAHKGTFGHLAVIAGSPGKTGAAYMASQAALKIGAGLVTLLIPASLNSIMEVKLTEVMTYPVEDDGTGFFVNVSFNQVKEFIKDKDAVVMGPGISQHPETSEFVRRIYTEMDKPFIIDADGINAFSGHLDVIKDTKRNAVFTPHPGELARLMGCTPKEINENKIEKGWEFAEKTGINLVLKGANTMIFTTDNNLYINPTGNPSLAKGGSGDILTGFIGGLVSQGYSLKEASILGVYLHGYIADKWIGSNSDMGLIACDLLDGIDAALVEIRDGKDRVYIEKSL